MKLLLSSLPIFVVGLSEDLGFFASPRLRLLATALSGLVFVALLGQWLPKTGLAWIDMPMKWAPFAIGFSLFVGVGVCHAFNLIDGVNGFSALIGISASLALAAISHQQGLIDHRDTLIILSVSIAGFLVFNFPFGRIFLGDAGAYLIGHILVWTRHIHLMDGTAGFSICGFISFLLANRGHFFSYRPTVNVWNIRFQT